MSSWDEHLSQHRRLGILRLLDTSPGYAGNESMLHDAVWRLGVTSTRDQIRSELTWLAEQGLVKIETVVDFMIARITQRGSEVAKGLVTIPGIKRPSPE